MQRHHLHTGCAVSLACCQHHSDCTEGKASSAAPETSDQTAGKNLNVKLRSTDLASHKSRFKFVLCHFMTSDMLSNLLNTQFPYSKVEKLYPPAKVIWDY